MVTGDPTVVNQKFKMAITKQWTSPGILVGNVTPNWKNNGGSVDRRTLIIDFGLVVHDSDPHLDEDLARELPSFIKKCNMAYLSAVRKFGQKNIWTKGILPQYFWDLREQLKCETNLLSAFLASDIVTVRKQAYMKQSEFRENFDLFVHRLNKKVQTLSPEYTNSIFQFQNIKVYKGSLPEDFQDGGSTRSNDTWMTGVCLSSKLRKDGNINPIDAEMIPLEDILIREGVVDANFFTRRGPAFVDYGEGAERDSVMERFTRTTGGGGSSMSKNGRAAPASSATRQEMHDFSEYMDPDVESYNN